MILLPQSSVPVQRPGDCGGTRIAAVAASYQNRYQCAGICRSPKLCALDGVERITIQRTATVWVIIDFLGVFTGIREVFQPLPPMERPDPAKNLAAMLCSKLLSRHRRHLLINPITLTRVFGRQQNCLLKENFQTHYKRCFVTFQSRSGAKRGQ